MNLKRYFFGKVRRKLKIELTKLSLILFACLAGSLLFADVHTLDDDPGDVFAKPPLYCYQEAIRIGFSSEQGILLCSSAKSREPIRCCNHVMEYLSKDQAVSLCGGVDSNGTAECFFESMIFNLTFDQQIKLCSGAEFRKGNIPTTSPFATGPVACYQRSLEFLLSADQRVILCANAESDAPVRCLELSQTFGISLDQRVRLCTKTSPSGW